MEDQNLDAQFEDIFALEPKGNSGEQIDMERARPVPQEMLDRYHSIDKNGRDVTTRNIGISVRNEHPDWMVRTVDGVTYVGPKH